MKKLRLTVFLLMLVCLLLGSPAPVQAQCKEPSTCKTCHEVQGQLPVHDLGDWHSQHSAFDFCAVCHGGDRTAQDKTAAHTGMYLTLSEMSGTCQNCHTADLEDCLSSYASQLGVDANAALSAVKPVDPSAALGQFLGAQPAFIEPGATAQPVGESPTGAPTEPASNRGNLILAGTLLGLVLGGGGWVTWNERRLRGAPAASSPLTTRLVRLLRRENWSPYAAGVLLGLVCIAAVWGSKHLPGASGAVSTITSGALHQIAPATVEDKMYFKFVMPPGMSWEVMLLIGMFFGGMLGALSSKTFKLRWNDDPTWKKVFGAQPWKRFVIGFVGAMILQFGAGIAGGCTSGLAISGGMLLAPSAFLFMAGMFASGILVALIVYRKRY